MAALYLHQALFQPADVPQPHSPSSRHSRQILSRQPSSFSSATVNASSENSHAPLVESYTDSPAYLDLLTRHPPNPFEGSAVTELSLHGDPITERERKGRREQTVRKRLHRLKWARRVFRAIISGWAIYNTIRYFLAFTTYPSHDRQVAALTLGSVAALSLALTLTSQVLGIFSPHFGWNYSATSLYTRLQTCLNYAASVLLLGPAIVNVVLTVLWRRSSDHAQSLQGRCHWDIDVVWSGTGFECGVDHTVSWGYWLAGAVARLVLTACILTACHFISYAYATTRRPSRRRMSRSRSVSSTGHTARSAPSFQSSRTMTSLTTTPVSLGGHPRLPNSRPTSSDFTHSSSNTSLNASPDTPGLRRSQSRITSDGQLLSEGRARQGRISFSSRSAPSSQGHSFRDEMIPESPTSSEEDYPNAVETDVYGRPAHRPSGTYISVPSPLTPLAESPNPLLQDEVHVFDDHFDSLMAQVARETDHGIHLAQNDQPGYYSPYQDPNPNPEAYEPFPTGEDDAEYVPVVGHFIQRMPTIESLGSREVMSLSSLQRGDRSVHTLSRPPTRATTLTNMMSEPSGSQPPSRSNSLTASIMLSSSAPEREGLGSGGIAELGAFSDSPQVSGGSSYHGATKSTLSYYTAKGSTGSSGDSANAPSQGPPASS
ncbi:hypothetical protein BDY19DRAFT_438484 [Irpex rosettiformis]|uniref:Uncharacterized protein n=1 Tax=Irpex rosettiformis TaxID=378272 RepID=A0ACB8TU27_9APHY|nr:hypothetical protein BDY19DRAFT_438484 [Irpex rosettiformis]